MPPVRPRKGVMRHTHNKSVRAKSGSAQALGARGGAKGGPARAAKLTKEQRSEIARQGGQARHKGD